LKLEFERRWGSTLETAFRHGRNPKETPTLATLKLQNANRIEEPPKHAPAPVQLISDAMRQANAKLDSGEAAGALADYREIFRIFEPSSESFLACYSAYQAAAKLEDKKELPAAKSFCDLTITNFERTKDLLDRVRHPKERKNAEALNWIT
jgi:hypothetical protein